MIVIDIIVVMVIVIVTVIFVIVAAFVTFVVVVVFVIVVGAVTVVVVVAKVATIFISSSPKPKSLSSKITLKCCRNHSKCCLVLCICECKLVYLSAAHINVRI